MKKRLAILLAVGILFVLHQAAHAQQAQYANPLPGCVQGFYDPSLYNWLAYRNTCSQNLYVSWISNSPGLNGSSDIPVGGKQSTGWSAKEIQSKGGLEVYACPSSYVPVDPNGNPLTRPTAQYSCKYRGY
jgi:hypothetical protein